MVDEGLGLGWRERWTLVDDGLGLGWRERWTLLDDGLALWVSVEADTRR